MGSVLAPSALADIAGEGHRLASPCKLLDVTRDRNLVSEDVFRSSDIVLMNRGAGTGGDDDNYRRGFGQKVIRLGARSRTKRGIQNGGKRLIKQEAENMRGRG